MSLKGLAALCCVLIGLVCFGAMGIFRYLLFRVRTGKEGKGIREEDFSWLARLATTMFYSGAVLLIVAGYLVLS